MGIKIANNTMRLIIFAERIAKVVRRQKIEKVSAFVNCGQLTESYQSISPISVTRAMAP